MTLATDPMQSERQRRAMYAAAAGNSNIGIPRSVGEKFTEHDSGGKKPESARDMERGDWLDMFRGFGKFLRFMMEEAAEPAHAADEDDEVKRRGAGVVLIEPTGRVLFVKRGLSSDHPGTWGFPGGIVEESDDNEAAAALRELYEEVGEFGDCSVDQLKPLDRRVCDGTDFTTFVQPIDGTFTPKLTDEHTDYRWAQLEDHPEPLHPGVKMTLDCLADGDAEDATGHDPSSGRFTTGSGTSNRDVVGHHGWKRSGGGMSEAGLPKRYGHESHPGHTITDPQNTRLEHHGWEHKDDKGETVAKGKSAASLHKHLSSFHGAGDADDPPGKLSETTREGVESSEHRENMPDDAFLGPNRTYPVKEKRDGEWRYTEDLLLAASRRARLQGRSDIARRADSIRAKEFGGEEPAEDATQLHNREVPKDFTWALSGKVGTGAAVTSMSRQVRRDMGGGAAASTGGVARDAMLAYDRATVEHVDGVRYHLEFDPTILAYDRDTMRDKDQDGRLHIKQSHISKATVNPYYGKEIPNYEALGLDADKKYMLLRDPKELAKGAATFNNVPILSQHVPLTAANHDPDLVIGSTGTDATYKHPYLDNSLVFWPQAAIDAIEDDDVKQLSCCYHYDPDMTPGEFEGQKYDGVMRNIRGNHVALVPEGRAGADVMVMDAMPRFEEGKHPRDHGKFSSGGGQPQHRHHEVLKGHGFSEPRHLEGGPHGSSAMYQHPEKGTVHLLPNGGWQHQLANGARSGQGAGGLHKSLSEPTGRFKLTKNGPEPYPHVQYKPGEVETAKKKYAAATGGGRDSTLRGVAGDSKESVAMKTAKLSPGAQVAKGALMAYLGPRLAADANIALNPLLAGVTGKNMKSKRGQIVAAVQTAVKGKLAADADVDDIADMLEGIEEICRAEEGPASTDDNPAGNANSAVPPFAREDDDEAEDDVPGLTPEAKAFLESKLSPEDYAALCDMSKPAGEDDDVTVVQTDDDDDPATAGDRRRAADEPPPFPGRPTPGGKPVTKEAMDAAIQAASQATEKRVRAQMRSISDAYGEVRPYVGDISGMAFDSAEGVYRHALKMLQVEGADNIHESALKTILGMQPKAAKRVGAGAPAMDARGGGNGGGSGGAVAGIATRFPGVAERLQRM